jgi:hypothetical protein
MRKILHRINTIAQLKNTPTKYGVEVDIRSWGKDLVIHHEPFEKGESFEKWLEFFNHKTLILNVKEEGLENRIIDLMSNYNIQDYFFLDQSFPFLIKTTSSGESRCAVRVSEFEGIETAMSLSGKVDWIWVDCFTHFPLTLSNARRLQTDGKFKLCFVSPELQGRTDVNYIENFRREVESLGIKGDAVCTKYPDLWD